MALRKTRYISKRSLLSPLFLSLVLIVTVFTTVMGQRYLKARAASDNGFKVTDATIESTSSDLGSKMKQYDSVSPQEKEQIKKTAQARKDYLKNKLDDNSNNPDQIAQIINSVKLDQTVSQLSQKTKDELSDVVEQPFSGAGEFTQLHIDNDQSSSTSYIFTGDDKKLYQVYSAKQTPELDLPKKVKIKGLRLGSTILIPADSGKGTISTATTSTLGYSRSGVLSISVIIIRFPGVDMTDAFGNDISASSVVSRFSYVKNYLEASSYYPKTSNSTSISIGTSDVTTVDYPNKPSSCDLAGWANYANGKVSSSVLSKNRIMYLFPRMDICKNSITGDVLNGAGEVKNVHTWINGNLSMRTLSHELTHNQGAWHSIAIYCGDGNQFTSYNDSKCKWAKDQASAGGESLEYADMYDVMGGGGKYQNSGKSLAENAAPELNGIIKQKIGWLSSSRISSVTSSKSSVTLLPLDTYVSSGTQVIKIPASKFNSSDNYYVEFRRPQGIDNVWPITSLSSGGVLIRLYGSTSKLVSSGSSTATTGLLDASNPIDTNFFDRALKNAGDSYVDNVNKVVIKLKSVSTSQATMCVGVGNTSYCN